MVPVRIPDYDASVRSGSQVSERPSAERLPADIEFGGRREERTGARPPVERLPVELPSEGARPNAGCLPETVEFEQKEGRRGESRRPEVERLPDDLQKPARREANADYVIEGEGGAPAEGRKKKKEDEWSPY